MHHLPCYYCILWNARIAGTTSKIPLFPPPLCVPVHPPLDEQVCGILWHPGMLGRGTFVELWVFYWLQMEGERLCHSAMLLMSQTPSLNGRMARSPSIRECGLGDIFGKYYLSYICNIYVYICVCLCVYTKRDRFPPQRTTLVNQSQLFFCSFVGIKVFTLSVLLPSPLPIIFQQHR